MVQGGAAVLCLFTGGVLIQSGECCKQAPQNRLCITPLSGSSTSFVESQGCCRELVSIK